MKNSQLCDPLHWKISKINTRWRLISWHKEKNHLAFTSKTGRPAQNLMHSLQPPANALIMCKFVYKVCLCVAKQRRRCHVHQCIQTSIQHQEWHVSTELWPSRRDQAWKRREAKKNETGKQREREASVCDGAEYSGCNYSVMGDKVTQEETEVWRCHALMLGITCDLNLSTLASCDKKRLPTCVQMIKPDAHQYNLRV